MTEGGLTPRLERLYTGVVHDVMRDMGLREQVLPAQIVPLDPALKLAGPAFTVSGRLDDTQTVDACIRAWVRFLSRATPGHVVVCQPNDGRLAHMGEISSETLKYRGVRGYVVDGGCRDVEFVLKQKFPVFRRYDTPLDIAGRWMVDAMDEPIVIGGVAIRPGDYVLGDRDGVVVIPRERAQAVIAASEIAQAEENQVRRAILDGVDPEVAYDRYGKF